MIVGITGAICSGKSVIARYLATRHGFEVINVLTIFKEALSIKRKNARRRLKMLRQSFDQRRKLKL